MLSLIAIIGKNREIGKNNKLIFHLPEDLARFRIITKGHPVIMGRKTYESILHPLPERTNIVISSNSSFKADGVITVMSLEQALDRAKYETGSDEIFVIGGASVYSQAISQAQRLYLTVVDADAPDADAFFPEYKKFRKIISREKHEKTVPPFEYLTLER